MPGASAEPSSYFGGWFSDGLFFEIRISQEGVVHVYPTIAIHYLYITCNVWGYVVLVWCKV